MKLPPCPQAARAAALLAALAPATALHAQHGDAAPSLPPPSATVPAAALTPEQEAAAAYAQARQALQAQQWTQAELLLERALMFQPEHAEARIDLAQLLAQRGRTETALAILQTLLDDPRTPAPQRARLQTLMDNTRRAALASLASRDGAPLPAPQPRHWAEWALGRSTNPLVNTSARDLTLTLPSGSVTLPLSPTPKAANYTNAWFGLQTTTGLGLQAQVQYVNLSQARTALRLAAQGPLPLPWPQTSPDDAINTPANAAGQGGTAAAASSASPPQWQWQAQTQRLLDGTERHQLGLQATQGHWQWQAGLYTEPQLNRRGPYLRLLRAWGPPHASAQWLAWADAEQNRAGGAPSFVRAGAQLTLAPAPAWEWQVQAQQHQDLAGYSPLLESGARRRLRTLSLTLDYQLSAAPAHAWVLRSYAARRWSPMPLFAWRDAGLQLIWRSVW